MTRLASYSTPTGMRIELHREGVRLWTERIGSDGSRTLVAVDTLRAAEHYELAAREGHVDRAFPFVVKVAS